MAEKGQTLDHRPLGERSRQKEPIGRVIKCFRDRDIRIESEHTKPIAHGSPRSQKEMASLTMTRGRNIRATRVRNTTSI